MFRKAMLSSLIMVLFYTTVAFGATSITFTFANGQITGTDPTYYEFDVMAAAGASGTRIGDCMAYINYNTEYFGSWVKSNSKITVSRGTLTQGDYYQLMVNDNTASRVAITAEYIKRDQPELANELPTTPTQWVHVKIEIADPSKTRSLGFEQSLMSGNEYESDNSTKYSPVIATNEEQITGTTSINFTFSQKSFTGTNPMYCDFDVMAAAGESGTRIGDCMAYINYTEYYGSWLESNGKITVSRGTLTQGDYYQLMVNDNTASRVAITAEYIKRDQPELANELPTTPTQWVHVKIEIANPSSTRSLSFEQSLMSGNEYESDNSTKYSPVNATDISLPVELSSFTAIESTDGVNLEWTTQTEVNNVGFFIYRSETKASEYVRVNKKIIKGAGNSDMLHTYSYTDEGVSPYVNTYFYYLEDVDIAGIKAKSQIIKVTRQKVKVKIIPDSFALFQNYPNPYNPETWIPYRLPVDTTVTIKIYDVTGRVVRTFSLGEKEAGVYTSRKEATYWNGRNEAGERVNSGLYFYAIEAGNFKAIKRMLLVK